MRGREREIGRERVVVCVSDVEKVVERSVEKVKDD